MSQPATKKPLDNDDIIFHEVAMFNDRLKQRYIEKIETHFGPARVHQFMNIIWPAHDRQNPDWHYIGRRLLDISFFCYWIDGPDEVQQDLTFLASIAFMRECLK